MKITGQVIKQVRVSTGLNQKEFGKIMGVTQGQQSEYETEAAKPSGPYKQLLRYRFLDKQPKQEDRRQRVIIREAKIPNEPGHVKREKEEKRLILEKWEGLDRQEIINLITFMKTMPDLLAKVESLTKKVKDTNVEIERIKQEK